MSPLSQADHSSTSHGDQAGTSHDGDDSRHEDSEPSTSTTIGKKKKEGGTKRRKVNHACLYCRRSHMTCDDGRPCQRCIKREIGHLCRDEAKPKVPQHPDHPHGPEIDPLIPEPSSNTLQPGAPFSFPPADPSGASTWPLLFPQETLGNEFSVLSDFLESLEDQSFFNGGQIQNGNQNPMLQNTQFGSAQNQDGMMSQSQQQQQFGYQGQQQNLQDPFHTPQMGGFLQPMPQQQQNFQQIQLQPQPQQLPTLQPQQPPPPQKPSHPHDEHVQVLPTATKAERFLLTAADQEDGTRDERLARVIHAKYEAGLLKPFNYVKGYARLSRWMEKNVSPQSKQQILQPLSILRPKFRAIAQGLTDIDLVFIEEAFERLLLDYDRVFSAMGIPACLWRRTGEIYKGNKEFADLVGVDVTRLREGRLCIYELMAEESAVNYWEKYGHVAFDTAQKAVLTSCVLRYKPSPASFSGPTPPSGPSTTNNSSSTATGKKAANGKKDKAPPAMQEGFINCCFSFTIQRDLHGIPTLIAGNFIRH